MSKSMNINLEMLQEVALRGVRRASIFLGLGVNAATDPNFKEYQLTSFSQIQLVPDNLPDSEVGRIKEEFRIWIEAGGFRELVESFVNFIDGAHKVCFFIADVQNRRGSLVEFRKFEKKGLPEKLEILKANFAVEPSNRAQILSLSMARNCLTHRRGIVGPEDLRDSESLDISWLGADLYIEEPGGNRIIFDVDSPEIYLPDGGTVCMGMVNRLKSFKSGEKLLLSTRELSEICWFYTREAGAVVKSLENHLRAVGVPFAEKQT